MKTQTTIVISTTIERPLKFESMPATLGRLPGVSSYSILGHEKQFAVVTLTARGVMKIATDPNRAAVFNRQLAAFTAFDQRHLLVTCPMRHIARLMATSQITTADEALDMLGQLAERNEFSLGWARDVRDAAQIIERTATYYLEQHQAK